MNVAFLFFNDSAQASPTKTRGPDTSNAGGESGRGFEQVLGGLMDRSAKAKALRSQTPQAKPPPTRTVRVDKSRREEAIAAVQNFLVQAAVPPPEPVQAAAGQRPAEGAERVVQVQMEGFSAEEAKALVQRLSRLLAQMGFSDEQIQQVLDVQVMDVEMEETTVFRDVVPVRGDAAQGAGEGETNMKVTLTLALEAEAPVSDAPSTAPPPSEEGSTRSTVPSSVQEGNTPVSPGEAKMTPVPPVPRETGVTAMQRDVPEAIQTQTPTMTTAQAEAESKTPPTPVHTTEQPNPTTGKADVPAPAVLTEATPQRDRNTGPEAAGSLRELAALLADEAQKGRKVVMRIHTANQDQTPPAQADAAMEEARLVVVPTRTDGGEDVAKATEAQAVTVPVDAPEEAPQGPLAAALVKTALPVEETDRGKRTSLKVHATRAGKEAVSDGELPPPTQAVPSPGRAAQDRAYAGALGRLVKLENVATLLRQVQSDSGDAAVQAAEQAAKSTPVQNDAPTWLQDLGSALRTGEPTAPVVRFVTVPDTLTLPQEEQSARAVLVSKLSQRMALMGSTGAGAHEVRLQLKPEHLGDIRMRLETIEGVVKAHFVVESQRVQELLQSGLGSLRQELQQSGMKLEHFQVSVRGDDQGNDLAQAGQQGGEGSGRGHQGRGPMGGEVDSLPGAWFGFGEAEFNPSDAAVNVLV